MTHKQYHLAKLALVERLPQFTPKKNPQSDGENTKQGDTRQVKGEQTNPAE
jgi:hypothetical protein